MQVAPLLWDNDYMARFEEGADQLERRWGLMTAAKELKAKAPECAQRAGEAEARIAAEVAMAASAVAASNARHDILSQRRAEGLERQKMSKQRS